MHSYRPGHWGCLLYPMAVTVRFGVLIRTSVSRVFLEVVF